MAGRQPRRVRPPVPSSTASSDDRLPADRAEWRHDRLQVTAIVNETYVKLFDQREVDWQNRGHFFAIAAQLMRRILIDHARHQTRHKRGGKTVHRGADDSTIPAEQPVDAVDVLDSTAL